MQLNLMQIRNWIDEVGNVKLAFLATLTVGHLVVHWYTNLLSLVLPFIKEDLTLNDVQIGTVVTTQMGIGSGLIIVSGFLADSFRRHGALIVSIGIASLGLALFLIGISPSYVWTLMGAGMVGLGTSLWHPAAMRALSLHFPEQRGMALSIHGVGASLGDSIGPIIVGAIILVADWKLVLGWHLIPALMATLFLWKNLGVMREDNVQKSSQDSYVSGIKAICGDRQAIAIIASNTLILMSRLSVLAFFPIYIKETLGYSAFALGVYLALLYITGMFSLPVMGILSDRIGRKMILVPSFALMGFLYMGIFMVSGGVVLGLVIGTLGVFFYAVMNMTQTAIMDVAPERVQASTMGIMSLVGLPFTLASPILAGYLVTAFGIKSAFLYASVSAFLASLILIPIQFRHSGLSRPSLEDIQPQL